MFCQCIGEFEIICFSQLFQHECSVQLTCQLGFAQEDLAKPELVYTDCIINITTLALLQQCQQAITSSDVCCLALLTKEAALGQQYSSSRRPLSRVQTTSALKAAGSSVSKAM